MSKKPSMSRREFLKTGAGGSAVAAGFIAPVGGREALPAPQNEGKPAKVFMITDMEGVSGIIPVIMLSGDTAACIELRRLVPQAECAEVKSGVSRTAGFMLPHPKACALIHETARRAMNREIPPYRLTGPVGVKVEFTTRGVRSFRPRDGVEQLDERTWAFRGRDLREAWLKYSAF